jgi:ADP-ribosylglycohydrolase
MMKQAPMAMYHAVSDIPESQIVREITHYSCMTHANKISVVSAIVHNKMLIDLILSEGNLDKKSLIVGLYELALKHEKEIQNLDSN